MFRYGSVMARPVEYDPIEDEIILATAGQDVHVVNDMLEKAGFPPRSANSIRNRRNRLMHGAFGRELPAVERPSDTIAVLDARRRALVSQISRLQAEITDRERELIGVLSDLKKEVERLSVEQLPPTATPTSPSGERAGTATRTRRATKAG